MNSSWQPWSWKREYYGFMLIVEPYDDRFLLVVRRGGPDSLGVGVYSSYKDSLPEAMLAAEQWVDTELLVDAMEG